MTNPHPARGGSYLRLPDGTLQLIEATDTTSPATDAPHAVAGSRRARTSRHAHKNAPRSEDVGVQSDAPAAVSTPAAGLDVTAPPLSEI